MYAKKVLRRLRGENEPADVDLTSLMDIFTNVLIFLILTSVFIKATIINLSLPQQSAAQENPDVNKKIKVVILKLEEKGLKLGGNLGGKYPFIPLKNGDYQYDALVENLKAIKKDNPEHQDIILLIKDNIKYEKIIKIMDTTREYIVTENGGETLKELFPVASLGEG